LRTDVAFAMAHYEMSERQACKLVDLNRSSYRYEPRPDHNAELRQTLVELARQKPRYGYRRLHAVLSRRGSPVSPQRGSDGPAAQTEATLAPSYGFASGAIQPGMGAGFCL